MSKVLVVEDDEYVRDYIKAHLLDWGHIVIDTNHGVKALELVAQESPDLLVIDINMPGMTGYELMTKVRDDPKSSEIPMIALTANNRAEDRDHAYEAGCAAYITKPIVDMDILKQAVDRVLA